MDANIAIWIHEHLPTSGFLKSFISLSSDLGLFWVLLFIVITCSLFLTFTARFNKAHILILSAIIASLASNIIKNIVARPRPILWEHMDKAIHGYSFPSGHVLKTTIIYGILAVFLAEGYPKRRRLIYGITGIILFIIGFSRVYLGVHWPTDVLAGWLIGGVVLWIMTWWYRHGGITRTVRIIIGSVAILFGLVGLILPIIPGIPLLIGGFLLVFSSKSLMEMLGQKKTSQVT